MRATELTPVLTDLQRLVGLPLAGVWQSARDRLTIGLGRSDLLLLVPRGPLARLHPVDRRGKSPDKPFSFQGACRAHLHGPLTRLEQVPEDRVVDLWFGDHRLHLRLTGRGGGLWLLQGDAPIAAYDGPAPAVLPELPSLPPLAHPPRFEPAEGESWETAARRWFTAEASRRDLEETRNRVSRGLKQQLQRTSRLIEALEADLDRARRAPEVRAQADTLAANLHTLGKGRDHVLLADLENPDHLWRIELDPSRPPVATMETLYRRARRLDRVGDRVLDQLIAAEERREALATASQAASEADLPRLRELEGLLPTTTASHQGTKRAPYDTWVGPNGEQVLVGRNEKSNRLLTFQRARGRDFWMHLRGVPGAHLILPMKDDQTPTKELLLAAAQIAMVQAKYAEGTPGEVQYTRVKHVRPIPGEIAKVTISEEKVLYVRRDPAALAGWSRV